MIEPFYSNDKIEQQLDLIHHMLQFGDELLLVSGEAGVGKSRQLRELIRRLGEGWQICHLSGKDNSQISQLFDRLSQSFGYDYSSVPPAELLSGFKHHLEQRETGKTYALLIDDAEQLDESMLEAVTHLSQLQNGRGPLLKVVLFGTRQLSDAAILKTVPLREVMIEPLDGEQSQGYVDFCIKQGRYEFGQPPSINRQQQIAKRAAGNPGQIEAMLQNSSRSIDGWKKVLDWRVGALALFLIAAAIGYVINSESEAPASKTVSALKVEKPTTLQQPVMRRQGAGTTTGASTVTPAAPQSRSSVPVPQDSDTALIRDLLDQGESLREDSSIPEVEAVTAVEHDEVMQRLVEPAQAVATGAESESLRMEPQGDLPVTETPTKAGPESSGERDRAWFLSQPATAFTIQLVAAEREGALDELIKREQLKRGLARFSFIRGGRIIHVLTQGLYNDRSSAEQAARGYSQRVRPWIRRIGDIHRLFKTSPSPVPDSPLAISSTKKGGLKDSAWIWSQDPEMSSIQLMAVGDRDMLEPYVRQSQSVGVTAILNLRRDGKPWYILLHGRYKTRDEARHAVAKLPQPLKSAKPWIRSFASLHDELSRSN